MSRLPPIPRRLSRDAKWVLWTGSPLYFLSAACFFLVTLVLFTFLLAYQAGFHNLVVLSSESVSVRAKISGIEGIVFLTGGSAKAARAQVLVNGSVVDAMGHGPLAELAQIGDEVTVIVPKLDPRSAYLEGFWPRIVSPWLLFQLAGLFSLPAIFGLAFCSHRAWRAHSLLQFGSEAEGKIIRTFPLPRPFRDKQIVRWEAQDEASQAASNFWTIQPKELAESTILKRGKQLGLAESLLPGWELQGKLLHTRHSWGKICAGLSTVLMVFQLILVLLFLTT